MEVGAQTRKLLLHKKLKLGWQICKIEDYVVATKCYKCSRFNHRARDCRGEESCPLCRKSQAEGMYNTSSGIQMHQMLQIQQTQSEENNLREPHYSDKNCPGLLAILEKHRKTSIIKMGPTTTTPTHHTAIE
jgi:hypothetical protein